MNNDQAEGLRWMFGGEISEFPNVPQLMRKQSARNRMIARQDDMREVVIPLIETASNEELQQMVVEIKGRAVHLNGMAPELEDWLCINAREIESKKGEE